MEYKYFYVVNSLKLASKIFRKIGQRAGEIMVVF